MAIDSEQYANNYYTKKPEFKMKRIIFFSILFLLLAAAKTSAQQQKYSTFYYQRTSLFEKLAITESDIVFAGNSITNGGEWGELFNDPRVKNRGISGDVCMGLYDRLEPILNGKPAKLFLLIGINDMGRGTEPDTVVAQIEKVIDKTRLLSPNTKIYLQSILPVNDSFGMFNGHTSRWQEIKPLNNELRKLSCLKNITYIDLFSAFVLPGTEKMNPAYTNDGLHLMGDGYLKWAEVVKPYVFEN